MGILDFSFYYIVVFLGLLTVLVFVHELGHYWVARRNGVRVEVFSIGFGPEIFGVDDSHGTRWKFSAIPLGGYVKMLGENEFGETESPDDPNARPPTEEERKESFIHKSLGARAAIVAAGPAANFLFAIIVMSLLFMTVGLQIPLSGIGTVQPGGAAEAAGFRKGDRVLAINGEQINDFSELADIVGLAPERKLTFDIIRDGERLTLAATMKAIETTGEDGTSITIGRLGVSPDPEQVRYERQNPLMAIWLGGERTFALTMNILGHIGQLIAGDLGAEDLGGPIKIARISGDMAQGGVVPLIVFMAVLSVNLGLLNLFPIPALDGGHLIFCLAELVRGRPLGRRAQEYGMRLGMILLLGLMVFVTWNDIVGIYTEHFG